MARNNQVTRALVFSRDLLRPLQGTHTLRVADTRELVGWVLSFGRGVRVLQPAGLRDRVREEALAVARHGGNEIAPRTGRRVIAGGNPRGGCGAGV